MGYQCQGCGWWDGAHQSNCSYFPKVETSGSVEMTAEHIANHPPFVTPGVSYAPVVESFSPEGIAQIEAIVRSVCAEPDRDSKLWQLFVAAVTSAWNLTNNGYAWTDRPKDEIANAAMRNARAALAVWESRNEEGK